LFQKAFFLKRYNLFLEKEYIRIRIFIVMGYNFVFFVFYLFFVSLQKAKKRKRYRKSGTSFYHTISKSNKASKKATL